MFEEQSCNNVACTVTVLLSAIVDQSGGFLILMFSADTDRAGKIPNVVFPCENGALAPGLGLGVGAQCVWLSARTLRANFGQRPSILLGDLVVFSATLKNALDATTVASTGLSAPLAAPDPLPQPMPLISGPQKVGGCSLVQLDSSNSQGNVGRDWVFRKWTKLNFNGGDSESSLGSGVMLSVLTVPLEPKGSGILHSYRLELRNWLGASGISYKNIEVEARSLPSITLPESLKIEKQNLLEVTASLVIDPYSRENCGFDPKAFLWEWTQMSGTPSIQLDPRVASSNTLTVFPNKFVAGNMYKFKLDAWPVFNPTARSSATVDVEVLRRPLRALIKGGDRHVGAGLAGVQVVLDGSSSSDPDNPATELSYQWTCLRFPVDSALSGTGTACSLGTTTPTMNTPTSVSSKLQVASTALSLDYVYQFALEVSSGSRASQAVPVLLTPVDGAIPFVSISLKNPLNLDISQWPDTQRLELQGSASSEDTGSLLLGWTQTQGNLDLSNPEVVPISLNTSALVIKERKLTAGVTYIFALTATNNITNKSASASFTVTINSPPSQGWCGGDPTSGVAHETPFNFRCEQWTDLTTHFPFQYQFELLQKGRRVLLSQWSREASRRGIRLPAGESGERTDVIASIRDKLGGRTEFQFSVNVSVNVTQPATKSAADLLDNLFDTALFNKDLDQVGLSIVLATYVLQTSTAVALNETLARQDIRDSMMDGLAQLISAIISSPSNQLRQIQLTQEITMSPTELSRSARDTALSISTELLLAQPAEAFQLEVAENGFVILGNAKEGVNVQFDLGGGDPEEAKALLERMATIRDLIAFGFGTQRVEEETSTLSTRDMTFATQRRSVDALSKVFSIPGTTASVALSASATDRSSV
eukprot:gb/GEZN01002025.1/.p1 GENE.gb/GEZN01002025.1/~~gb/GEZN01002025.1/.p1  ORF type:complete len:893 (+),score=104.11 gb/GEZN01002025.1/:48-2681(+)